MRIVVLIVLMLLFALPAVAAGWQRYDNARFGYGIDIPPGFAGRGEPANGDGQVFTHATGTRTLTVWGGLVGTPDFSVLANAAAGSARAEGWRLRNQAAMPGWMSFSGSRNGHVLFERLVAYCRGERYAAFRFVDPERDIAASKAVVERLQASLEAAPGTC